MNVDSVAHHKQLLESGELLATWPPPAFEETATNCFKVDQEYWIWQPGVGGICFVAEPSSFVACPAADVDREWFERLVRRSWLPAVYSIWGRQVLHASAVCAANGDVVAFSGPSGAGKSTLAYGLATRPGWTLICDDTLAFSCQRGAGGGVRLHRLNNEARLRPATAAYYRKVGVPPALLDWPQGPLRLKVMYFLSGDPHSSRPAHIRKLRGAETYPLLLEQAHAVTLKIPKQNQQLMRDYLELAAAVPAYHLVYRKSFAAVGAVFDALDAHLRTVGTPSVQAGAGVV